MLSNNENTKGNIMRIGTMLDVKTIKNLEEIKSEKSFEEQYDEGLRRLNFNRQSKVNGLLFQYLIPLEFKLILKIKI